MITEISKKFTFESAHWIPSFPEGHKCRRLHGHSFRLEVVIRGEVNPETGILMDFGDIKKIVKPLIDYLDHQCLNHLGEQTNDPLLLNPTSENLCLWFYRQLESRLPMLSAIILHETCTSKCVIRKPDC